MLTRDQVRRLRDDIQDKLDKLKVKGFKLQLGNCTFGATAVFKLEVCPVSKSGEVVSKAAADYKRWAASFGLPADGLGKTVKTTGGRTHTVTGINPRSRKYPVTTLGDDGKPYKFAAATIAMLLKK